MATANLNDCGKSSEMDLVLSNERIISRAKKVSEARIVRRKQAIKTKYMCSKYSKEFKSNKTLQVHNRIIHRINESKRTLETLSHEQCQHLQSSYFKNDSIVLQRSGNVRHARKSVKERLVQSQQSDVIFMKHLCSQCNSRKFYNSTTLQAHVQKRHCSNVKQMKLSNAYLQACSTLQIVDKLIPVKRSQRIKNKQMSRDISCIVEDNQDIRKENRSKSSSIKQQDEVNDQSVKFKTSKTYL